MNPLGRTALALLIVGLTAPAAWAHEANEQPSARRRGLFSTAVPWAAEAPGAAGARFGLGLDLFFERQESLAITSREGSLQSDPELLNRKFDYRFEMAGAGVQLPVALPSLGPSGAFRLYPTLVLQAAGVDVSFDFLDRTRQQDSSSLEGRGSLFGVGLDLATSPCRNCPWFAGAGFRYQKLPNLRVVRSPPFAAAGIEVLDDDVHLSREVQEVSTKVGYTFFGGRVVSYLGVRHRWTDLEIKDALRIWGPFQGGETTLESRTELESEATLAVAGVEGHLGGPLYGRFETSYGEEDFGVLVKAVYLAKAPSIGAGLSTDRQTAPQLAERIHRIRMDFQQASERLSEDQDFDTVNSLFNRIERELLNVLHLPEFAAMRDWVRDRFRRARDLLTARDTGGSRSLSLSALEELASATITASMLAQVAQNNEQTDGFWKAVSFLQQALALLERRFRDDDIRVELCVRTLPEQGATVVIYPPSYRRGKQDFSSNERQSVPRGLFAYWVTREGYRKIECLPEQPDTTCLKLDLMNRDRPYVRCTLATEAEAASRGECKVLPEPAGGLDCEAQED